MLDVEVHPQYARNGWIYLVVLGDRCRATRAAAAAAGGAAARRRRADAAVEGRPIPRR